MRLGLAALACVWLALAPAAAAPPEAAAPEARAAAFAAGLELAAAARPDDAYAAPADAPADFKALLSGRGYPARRLTNREAWELYRSARPPTSRPSAPDRAAPRPRAVGDAGAVTGANFDGTKALTGGPDPVAAPGATDPWEQKKDKGRWQGLRLFGLELRGGYDPLKQDNEPYLRKGIPQLFDWDIRARVDIEGLGASASYRHPQNLRSFSVGFLKYLDLPAVLGAGSVRDKLYGAFGAAPEKPTGGFEVSAWGAINQHLGGATTFDWKDATWRDRVTDYWLLKSEAGYTPLGENRGKPWNYTLLLSGNYENLAVKEGDYAALKKGFGASVGIAFQEALNRVPIPGIQPHPGPGSDFLLDRVRLRLDAGPMDVTGAASRVSAQVTALILRHLELSGGPQLTFYPDPDWRDPQAKYVDLAAILGVGLRY